MLYQELNRVSRVARSSQRLGQRDRRSRIVRIVLGRPLQPLQDRFRITIRLPPRSERLEHFKSLDRQDVSFVIYPALEFVRSVQVKSVEERTAVQTCRALEISCLQCSLELGDVRRYEIGVQADEVPGCQDGFGAESLAQDVELVRQAVTRALPVGVFPQEGHQPVAGDPTTIGCGQTGEYGDRARP